MLATLWLRGLFATDVWVSHRYNAGTGLLESRTFEACGGWLVYTRALVQLPAGTAAPQARQPMDGTWGHVAGPPDQSSVSLPGRKGLVALRYRANPAPPASATRAIRVAGYAATGVRLPALIVVASVLPGLWVVHRLRRRRAAPPGCCPACGYDLRASPERCPECGLPRTGAAR